MNDYRFITSADLNWQLFGMRHTFFSTIINKTVIVFQGQQEKIMLL